MGRCACRRRRRIAPAPREGAADAARRPPQFVLPPPVLSDPPPRLPRACSRDKWTLESIVPPGEMLYYPMYAVRVADFMNMSSAPPHQVLKSHGLVDTFSPSDGNVCMFVSHQWCGRDRADPQFRQLRVLQRVLERMSLGVLRVDPDFYSTLAFRMKTSVRPGHFLDAMTWHMWFDYFSVPQPKANVVEVSRRLDLESDLGKAVASLSAYVASCELFLVLAPTIVHENGSVIDFATWKSRGWCRLERFARVMSDQRMPMPVVRQEDVVLQMGAQDYLLDGVALGCFSDPGDRPHVNRLVLKLLQYKLQRLLQANRMHEFRRLVCARTAILEGIGVDELSDFGNALISIGDGQPSNEHLPAMAAANFLRCIGASSPLQRLGGTTPLLLASCVGDVNAMRGLLESRADIKCCEKYDDAQFVVHKGRQPLHCAARYGHTNAIELLLSYRAEVDARDSLRSTPLHAAVPLRKRCKEATLKLLLERRADIHARNRLGNTPLELCAVFSIPEVAAFLLSAGASPSKGPEGLNPAHHCGTFGAVEVCRLLLEAKASVHDVFRPRFGSVLALAAGACSLSFRLGNRGFVTLAGYHMLGASPLAAAVMHGHLMEAKVMLEGRADPEQKNSRGATPKDLARIFRSFDDEPTWLFAPHGYISD